MQDLFLVYVNDGLIKGYCCIMNMLIELCINTPPNPSYSYYQINTRILEHEDQHMSCDGIKGTVSQGIDLHLILFIKPDKLMTNSKNNVVNYCVLKEKFYFEN